MAQLVVKLQLKDRSCISKIMQIPAEPKAPGERQFGPAERYIHDDLVATLREKALDGGWSLDGSSIEYELKPDLYRAKTASRGAE